MKVFLDWEDVKKITGKSRAQAYRIINDLNAEQEEAGYRIIRGKVSVRRFCRSYDLTQEEVEQICSRG